MNRINTAKFFGVNTSTIDKWINLGCPYIQKGGVGKQWKLDTAKVFTWRLEREKEANTPTEFENKMKQQKLRLITAQAENEEIKAQVATNTLIDVEQMRGTFAEVFTMMRSNLLSIPERTEATLLGETDKDVFKKTLTREIKDAMFAICDDLERTMERVIEGAA